MKADQARALALHDTMQALPSEMAEQVPELELVATRLADKHEQRRRIYDSRKPRIFLAHVSH
jgi:hypothetical protein